MFCSKCGGQVSERAAFCEVCGQPVPSEAVGSSSVPATTPPLIQPVGAPAVAAPVVLYAGFWLRFVAFIIDAIVLWFAGAIVMLPFMASLGLRGVLTGRPPMMGPGDVVVLMGTFFWVIVARVALNWLYYAGFESSPWQATLGKKALGLEVTDLAGRRIGFGRASGRFFGKIISSLTLLIGYIMAGFTEKKQALHDMIASCLVLRKA
jgi:uncharacterized RDD family membrane protein YckC